MTGVWTFNINDIVWAKMRGYSAWPGLVTEPTDSLKKVVKKNSKCIFFFGTNNYAWIEDTNLKPYFQYKNVLTKCNHTTEFKNACKEVEKYIKENDLELIKNNGISESHNLRDSNPQSSTLNLNNEIYNAYSTTSIHSSSSKRHIEPEDESLTWNTQSNVKKISISKQNYQVIPSSFTFGFIGLGNIGFVIVTRLLNSGHKLVIWNRTTEKSNQFKKMGAKIVSTPSDVVKYSDITFSCIDSYNSKDLVLGNFGIISKICLGKGFVEMSSIDPDTSTEIGVAIQNKGGRYLETMIQGSTLEAQEGSLICFSAGDKTLFNDCRSLYSDIAKNYLYFGEVGRAAKIYLCLSLVQGIALAGLAEGMALAHRSGLSQKKLLDVLKHTQLNCPLFLQKANAMMNNNFMPNQSLKNVEKDLNMVINFSDSFNQECPITAVVREIFKNSMLRGYTNSDSSSIYIRSRY